MFSGADTILLSVTLQTPPALRENVPLGRTGMEHKDALIPFRAHDQRPIFLGEVWLFKRTVGPASENACFLLGQVQGVSKLGCFPRVIHRWRNKDIVHPELRVRGKYSQRQDRVSL